MKTLIIAEIGVNHNGSLELAKKLIDEAAESGADIAKFQTFRAEELVTKTAGKANYQLKGTNLNETQQEMLRQLELTDVMHAELITHCKKNNINFLSTGFDIKSINFLVSLGVNCFKIPSGEITNLPYLRHIGSIGGEVILSTGMSDLGEIEDAISILEHSGTPRKNISLLHCTSEYPASIDQINLKAMKTIKNAFNVNVGYSDHSQGIEVPIAAVALGASIIEKHLTLNKNLPGPDHQASLEPSEFKSMVTSIRNIERALGDGIKRVMPSEIDMKMVARKSIVAKCVISPGEKFTEENIATKRPGTGISPMLWDSILGKVAKRNFSVDEQIDL